jgi:hypothetical protein
VLIVGASTVTLKLSDFANVEDAAVAECDQT